MITWLLALVLVGCGGGEPAPAPPARAPAPAVPAPAAPPSGDATAEDAVRAERLDVRALSYPAAWLVERIGGQRVRVHNLAPEGEDPPSWRPPAEEIAALGTADLIVASGAGYEAWLATASLPEDKVVRAADGLDLLTLPGITHSHGKQGAHSHSGTDPHVWTDPTLLAAQARKVRDALVALDPKGTPVYDRHLLALQRELEHLDREQADALAPAAGRELGANHPSFHYLARRYGLRITDLHLDPEKAPDAAALERVNAWAARVGAEGGTPILLWETKPAAEVVAALPGIEHVTVSPLEQPIRGVYDPIRQTQSNIGIFRRLFATVAE